MRADATLRVGIRCDAGPTIGVGHLVRCVALAEEFVARGWEVVFLADLGGVAFAERQLTSRGLRRVGPPAGLEGHLDAVSRKRLDAVVLDSYELPPEVSAGLVAAGVPVLALVDGPLRGLTAQLYVDQNVGAEADAVVLPYGATRLAGTSFALLRDSVRRLRPTAPWTPRRAVTEVVVAFGGTDARGLTETAARALVGAAAPFRATVISPHAAVRARIRMLSPAVAPVPPVDHFPALLAAADLVVGASGSSAWEYCCLGLPAAAIAVVDNQQQVYERLVDLGAILGLGSLEEVLRDEKHFAERLAAALADPRARTAAANRAYELVDGNGRVRVANAFTDLVARHRR